MEPRKFLLQSQIIYFRQWGLFELLHFFDESFKNENGIGYLFSRVKELGLLSLSKSYLYFENKDKRVFFFTEFGPYDYNKLESSDYFEIDYKTFLESISEGIFNEFNSHYINKNGYSINQIQQKIISNVKGTINENSKIFQLKPMEKMEDKRSNSTWEYVNNFIIYDLTNSHIIIFTFGQD